MQALTIPTPDLEEGIHKIGVFWFSAACVFSLVGSLISFECVFSHLRNYRRPDLQRMTIRILMMIPIYSLASVISLSSKNFSAYIDMIRDLYEVS
jgi:hypothetical protein